MVKPLPFQLQRDVPVPLSNQIVDGVQRAIGDGYYQAGDRLPNLDEMAARLQVARQTVRVAVGSLVSRGAVVARRKRGIEVLDPGSRAFTHLVLHLARGGTSYYFGTRNARLAAQLNEARIRYMSVDLTGEELAAGLPHVRSVLAGNAVELVLIDGPTGMVEDLCREQEIPFVAVNNEPSPQAVVQLSTDHASGYRALAAHARSRQVRSVGLVAFQPLSSGLAAAFAEQDIVVQPVHAELGHRGLPEQVEEAGYRTVTRRLAEPPPLPDLLYFTDDYLARGGLTALLAHGVRVPEQLRVATLVNRGYCPAFPVTLTRLETAPLADGERLAEIALALLRTPRQPLPDTVLKPTLIVGESL
jgi:DNA-binding LacI/PurR family transcriptional regulator